MLNIIHELLKETYIVLAWIYPHHYNLIIVTVGKYISITSLQNWVIT